MTQLKDWHANRSLQKRASGRVCIGNSSWMVRSYSLALSLEYDEVIERLLNRGYMTRGIYGVECAAQRIPWKGLEQFVSFGSRPARRDMAVPVRPPIPAKIQCGRRRYAIGRFRNSGLLRRFRMRRQSQQLGSRS